MNSLSLATWNVNSIRARLPLVNRWLEEQQYDIVCLQEIKCQEHQFPSFDKYNTAIMGQKTYHGVSVLSHFPMDIEETSLPNNTKDKQARFLQVLVQPPKMPVIRVVCLYAPNGNPIFDDHGQNEHEKFLYKRSWMTKFFQHAKELLKQQEDLLLMGDFNIIPTKKDAKYPEKWEGDACYHPDMKALYGEMLDLGYEDALRKAYPDEDDLYTFWGYKAVSWKRNHGIRIDHILSRLQDRVVLNVGVDKDMRGKDKPSDHAPVWVTLKNS